MFVMGPRIALSAGAEAVVHRPLQVANPDDDLGQIVGVGARLDSVELLGAYPGEEGRKADGPRERRDLLLQVQKIFEAHVQEVPRPASRVQDLHPSKTLREAVEELLGPL